MRGLGWACEEVGCEMINELVDWNYVEIGMEIRDKVYLVSGRSLVQTSPTDCGVSSAIMSLNTEETVAH
jgi:hypothetical protein